MFKLPIDINVKFSSECWTFYKACIINTYKQGKEWLASHIDIFLDKNNNAHFGDGESLYPLQYYSEILNIGEIEINDIDSLDIVPYIKSLLKDGFYVILDCNLNQFFISDSEKDIDIHEMLLYGFNDEIKSFYSPMLNNETGKMEEITLPYTEMIKSFDNIKKHYQWHNNRFYRMYNFYYPLTIIRKKKYVISRDELAKRCLCKIDRELKGEKRLVSRINNTKQNNDQYSVYKGLSCLYGIIEIINEIIFNRIETKAKEFDITLNLLKLYEFRCNMLSTIETLCKITKEKYTELDYVKENYSKLVANIKKAYMMSFKWEKKKDFNILKNIKDILNQNILEEEEMYRQVFSIMIRWYNDKYVIKR